MSLFDLFLSSFLFFGKFITNMKPIFLTTTTTETKRKFSVANALNR